jgi:Fur family iron response transcriptional regulator
LQDISAMLRAVGLRPTYQRMALGRLLFDNGGRHVTAEMLYEKTVDAEVTVSLATVYNRLNQLANANLLRKIGVGGSKTYFDTNLSAHNHYFLEDSQELIDIIDPTALRQLPTAPEDYEIRMIIRLREKAGALAESPDRRW